MKITKRQLQRIIKEELSAVLGEDVNELALRQDRPQKGSVANLVSAMRRWVSDPRAKEHRSPQSVPAWRKEACEKIKREHARLGEDTENASGQMARGGGTQAEQDWQTRVSIVMSDAEILGCEVGE